MIVVAGPPGSGKSTAFPVTEFGVDHFNADDVAARLNAGRYVSISPEVRQQVNSQLEQFVADHISAQESFAIETTLRTFITFTQARRARRRGFRLLMYYVAVESADIAVERVAMRADAGGHSAPVSFIHQTYDDSLRHLPLALKQFDRVFVFDNTAVNSAPRSVLETNRGTMQWAAPPIPNWLQQATAGME